MGIVYNIDLDNLVEDLVDDDTKLFTQNVFHRNMEQFTPFKTGIMEQNVTINRDGIRYNSPYAHYQYEGILYVDPITEVGAFYNESYGYWSRPGVAKIPSERTLEQNTSQHPLATSHWGQATLNAKKQEISGEIKDFIADKFSKR